MRQAHAITPADTLPAQRAPHRVRRHRAYHRPGRLWLVSLLLFISFFAFIAFISLGVVMGLMNEKLYGFCSLAALALFLGTRIPAFFMARRTHCTLCHGTVLSEQRCRKHAKARRLPLLTYRATTVLRALFALGFRCMYCGTSFRLRK